MRTMLTATIALLLLTTSAQAQMVNERCSVNKTGYNCFTTYHEGGQRPNIIQVPAPIDAHEIAAAQARDEEWLRVCKPVPVLDKWGVTRMTYDAACPNAVVVGNGKRP